MWRLLGSFLVLLLLVIMMNEDLIVWGMCCGVLLMITILSYLTHLYFKPKEAKVTTPTAATIKWATKLRRKSVYPGVIRSLLSSNVARVSIEEQQEQQEQQHHHHQQHH